MEAHIAPMQPIQMNKITSSCDICSGPYETQYYMENLEQAFIEYASSRTDEAGGFMSDFMASQDARLSKFEADFKQQQSEMTDKINTILKAITDRMARALPSDTSFDTEFVHTKGDEGDIMFIEIVKKNDNSREEEPKAEELEVEYFDIFPTRRNFTYVTDFMIVEDISSIIDPSLSQVVLGKPFVKISNMTHDPPEGVVRFTNGTDEIAYKMPHVIEQYNSLSDLEKEHTNSVYLRNEEDKRRGVEYVMSKILGFYKECLELRPEYVTGITDEGEVT
ncbi:hypothetical protein Tco_0680563 [Tanacetum coccineum]|uniref:MAK10-like protein n=1 Tax=Tanacetum coccineum TaxID=301880 RepID=A0ABQ4XL70_9ASTR